MDAAQGRPKRRPKPASRLNDESEDEALLLPTVERTKLVYRLLDDKDVTGKLVGREVFVLWPDDGTWYRGTVKKCSPTEMSAVIYYVDTAEKEVADLAALTAEGQIAFKESRPAGHQLQRSEVDLDEVYRGRPMGVERRPRQSAAGGGAKRGRKASALEEEDEDSIVDAGARSGDSSDPSFSSGDAAGQRKRGRRHADEEEEEDGGNSAGATPGTGADRRRRRAQAGGIEDDDELPLGQRLTEMKQQQGQKRPRRRQSDAGGQQQRRRRGEGGGDSEDEGERLLAQAVAAPPAAAALWRRRSSEAGAGHSAEMDHDVRLKVKGWFQQALELAAQEEGGEAGAPAAVAAALEDALMRLHGGTTKEYRERIRTLHFNLKHPDNRELRAHVLRGDIDPAAFVRMTATELASKELAAYRKRKEEEALKMSVLDAEAAAKFSTAAALEAAAPAEPPQPAAGVGEHPRSALPSLPSAPAAGEIPGSAGDQRDAAARAGSDNLPASAAEEYDVEAGPAPAAAPLQSQRSATAAAAGPGIDWATIKAQAVQAFHEPSELLPPLPSLEQFNHAPATAEHPADARPAATEHREGAPREAPSPASAGAGGSASLRALLQPPLNPAWLGRGVWEAEVVAPGAASFLMTADALAGAGDLAALLGDAELSVRGRLAIGKLDSFLTELHLSKHRTATVGVLRPAEGATAEERAAVEELVVQYAGRGRTGVAEPQRAVEAYLVPACEVAARVLDAARAAEPAAVEAALPGGRALRPDELLAVVIHKRDWQQPPGFVRPVKRPRLHTAAAAAAQPALPPVPAVPPPAAEPQLPPSLDFSALSALAAAFGVGAAAAPPSQAAPSGPAPASGSSAPDFSALSALAAAFGVGAAAAPPSQAAPPPSGLAPDSGPSAAVPQARQSRWEAPPPQQQPQYPPPAW